ncbi:MAG: esterase family protein [Chitinophagaceae bacterium]
MTENYHKWYSPAIGQEFEMLVFGDHGFPVILFPTSLGSYFESKDRGLIESARKLIENGRIKIYCPDSIDHLSWYNKNVEPSIRTYNHICYDKLILEEVVPRASQETGFFRVATAGCGFGGYHAANFAFKHPQKVSYLISMSGIFDVRSRLDGFYDDNVYFNNPVDFLPDNGDEYLWKMGIILGCAEFDICREQNENLSSMMDKKGMAHWLDIRPNTTHDWPFWKEKFPSYLDQVH